LMLGSNDFQSMHSYNAWHSAQGIGALVSCIRHAPVEPSMVIPQILLVVPPLIKEPKGLIAPKFAFAERRCIGLSDAYREKAIELNCAFFDSNTIISPSQVDGIHLDIEQHLTLGLGLANRVGELLPKI
ncbi:MAG: GDSL family lipase, partial [Thiohalomonadales bacterium]